MPGTVSVTSGALDSRCCDLRDPILIQPGMLKVMDYVHGASRSDLDQDSRLLSACCYQIAVIGEAAKRLSPAVRTKHTKVQWKDIAGMRDRLIHGYDSVDIDELWKTATED